MGDIQAKCWWCRRPLASSRARYCPRPATCRQQAYRGRRQAAAAARHRAALADFGYRLQETLAATREVLLDVVLIEDPAHGVLAVLAAAVERDSERLVRGAVLAERAAGTGWAAIGEAFGLTADAARHRWSGYEITNLPPLDDHDQGPTAEG